MAKHFVKLGDGHWAWLSEEEYKKHRRGGCLTTIIALLIFVGIAQNEDKESKDKNKSNFKTEQVSKKKKTNNKKDNNAVTRAKQLTHEEYADKESEQNIIFDLQPEPIGESEEIIISREPESNDTNGIIDLEL